MNDPDFDISFHVDADAGVLRAAIIGELDLAVEHRLIAAVTTALAQSSHLVQETVFDLRQIRFADSSGLRAVMISYDLAKDAGLRPSLLVTSGPMTRLLDVAGVKDWFDYTNAE